MEIKEKKLKFDDVDLLTLLGYNDTFLNLIENKFHSVITVRGNNLILKGEYNELKAIEKVFNELIYIIKRSGKLTQNDVITVLGLVDEEKPVYSDKNHSASNNIIYHGIKDIIRAKTPKQKNYYNKVLTNDMVFAIGPAGTGKTFLAVAMALAALKNNEVTKIILSRPAVEAGESLGYLPGDLQEKLDPYLKPLTDALFFMVPADKLKSMSEKNIIEIIPLAYMRGRTLNNSFIILDEAQNATITQMKMFLTRLGENSKAIITGDITQIDLAKKEQSGLINANRVLQNIDGIEFVYFDEHDVVRHRLVTEIIRAYERDSANQETAPQQDEVKDGIQTGSLNNID